MFQRVKLVSANISNYKKVISEKFQIVSDTNDRIAKAPLDVIVKKYDEGMADIRRSEIQIQGFTETLKTNIKTLEECKDLYVEFSKLYENMKITMNNRKVGTLEGLVRDKIKTNRIPLGEIGQTVYDDNANRNGGKKNKTKRKKYTKIKNRNNKSKNRRFSN